MYDPSEDVVYFGSDDGALYKVAASNGKLLWRFMSASQVNRQPALHGGRLFFANANDTVVAVEAQTGKMLWQQRRAPIGGMSIAGYAGVAYGDGRVFVAFSDGNVGCFEAATGASLWPPVDLSEKAESDVTDEPVKYFDVDTTPVLDTISSGPVVYVAGYASGVKALDRTTGAPIWANDRISDSYELTVWKQPAHASDDGGPMIPARKLLIVSTGASGLWALDPEDGTEVWRVPLPEGGVSAPAAIAGTLLVTTSQRGLFLISPLDGKVIDGIELGMTFSMAPAAYGNRAFVLSDGGAWLSLHVSPPRGR